MRFPRAWQKIRVAIYLSAATAFNQRVSAVLM
jgi:hypothetical protein